MNENGLFRKEINLRDLGGLQCVDGRVVRCGEFYRSCNLSRMNQEELSHLKQLGIRTVLDLRTDYESMENPDPAIDGMENYRVSGMRDFNGVGVDYSLEGMKRMRLSSKDPSEVQEHMHALYPAMMHHNQAFAFFRLMVIDSPELPHGGDYMPLLFHCATGKDRTGAVAMLIELALGVREDEIMKDYLKSNESFHEKIEKALKENQEEIAKNPLLKDQIISENGVLESYGKAMLASVHSSYASLYDFFEKEYSISRKELENFRNRFLILKK